jgi:ribonucleoside-diphosphate reductase beta chain
VDRLDPGLDKIETPEQRKQFLLNLICFATCIEGLFFFAAFAYVYFLRSKGLLNGLADGTNWVFRDESCHMNFAFEVVDTVRKEEPELFDDRARGRHPRDAQRGDRLRAPVRRRRARRGRAGDEPRRHPHVPRVRRRPAPGAARLRPRVRLEEPVQLHGAAGRAGLSNFFERTVSSYQVGVAGDVAFDEEF